jgi:hypothetical protein
MGENGLAPGGARRATPIQHCDPKRKEGEMSITESVIGEHDVVTLRNPVEGVPAGTNGAVISTFPTRMWVEVADESDEWGFRIIFVPTDQLELVWKSDQGDSGD